MPLCCAARPLFSMPHRPPTRFASRAMGPTRSPWTTSGWMNFTGWWPTSRSIQARGEGAWTEGDVFDSVGLHRTWRHFFVKKDDPNLMTDPEIAAEEAYVLRDLIAARSRMGISTHFHPLLEMGDSISYDGRN